MPTRLTTLGAPSVEAEGLDAGAIARQPLRFALLTYLAMEGPRPRADVLAKFWGDRPEDRARATLNQTVYQLRRTLGSERISVSGSEITVQGVSVDAVEFAAAVRAGEFERATALYGGHFLAGLGGTGAWEFEDWAERNRSTLQQLYHDAASAHFDRLLERGDSEEALDLARAWIGLEPLAERPRAGLVRLLAESGQRRAALVEHDRYARLLASELDVEPSQEMRALAELVRSGEVRGSPLSKRLTGPDTERHDWDRGVRKSPGDGRSPASVPSRDRDPAADRFARPILRPAVLTIVGAAIIAVLAVTSGLAREDDPGPEGSAGRFPLSRVAVLEFEGSGPDAYLGRALSSALIGQLSRSRGLTVISSSGVRLFRDSTISLDSLRRTLQVGSIVEGRTDRVGRGFRVEVRLIDAATGSALNSRSLVRDSAEIFDLMDATAQTVADFLRGAMDAEVRLREYEAGTASAGAWRAVMEARHLRDRIPGMLRLRRFDEASGELDAIEERLSYARTLDPGWPEPWVELAINAGWRARMAGMFDGDPEAAGRWAVAGEDFARRALALDSTSVGALVERARALLARADWGMRSSTQPAAVGVAAASADSLLELASSALERATTLDPGNADAWAARSELDGRAGRHASASVAAGHAYTLDPFRPDAGGLVYRLFESDFALDRDHSAARWCEEGRRRFREQPPFVYCHLMLNAFSDDVQPDPELMRALLDSIPALQLNAQPELEARFEMMMASVLARAGRAAEAARVIASARSAAPDDPALLWMEAAARDLLGEEAASRRLLRRFQEVAPADALRVLRSRPFGGVGEAVVP